MELPAAVAATVGAPDVQLVLHNICFSHYCERARWTLRLLGIPFKEVCGCGRHIGAALGRHSHEP
jgi:hypothetical protein